MKCFAPEKQITAICIEAEGKLVAAILLFRDTLRGIYTVYKLPVNSWANSGDLLIDQAIDSTPVLEVLIEGIEQHSMSLLCLDEISLESPQWFDFERAVQHRAGHIFVTEVHPVGVIDVLHDWDNYEKSWSANHRGAVKRTLRKLEKQGDLRLERFPSLSGQQLADLMKTAFDIEDRSWKDQAGSSVKRSAGILEYMLREAQLVAEAGYLDLWFLYFDEAPISFEYCHCSKGTCFSHKIGYEPEFAKFGPGRLLRYLQLQQYHANDQCRLFNMMGTFCESKAKWATRSYQVGRMYASVGSKLSNAMLRGFAWARPTWQSIRGESATTVPKLGAADYLQSAVEHSIAT